MKQKGAELLLEQTGIGLATPPRSAAPVVSKVLFISYQHSCWKQALQRDDAAERNAVLPEDSLVSLAIQHARTVLSWLPIKADVCAPVDNAVIQVFLSILKRPVVLHFEFVVGL